MPAKPLAKLHRIRPINVSYWVILLARGRAWIIVPVAGNLTVGSLHKHGILAIRYLVLPNQKLGNIWYAVQALDCSFLRSRRISLWITAHEKGTGGHPYQFHVKRLGDDH